jgi:acetylornithine/N-succinyldiaminopimelate aminotransferase
MKKWDDVFMANYGTPALTLVSGVGNKVKDDRGHEYLDFLGGIATNILGHAHPAITAAVTKQLSELTHVSNFYAHPQGLKLAEELQSLVGQPSARTFFCNSGAEANEAALKISRLTGRKQIVAFTNSFHGRTMGALSMTGQPSKRDPFTPLIPKITFLPYGDVRALKRGITKRTAMVIVEPIQGEAGVIVPPSGFLPALRERCDETGALLTVDEVQTGMGRTGSWFAYQQAGITPDIITLAKGLGGGLPLGATIGIGRAAALLQAGSHGSTFGGSPTSVAAARAAISVLKEEEILERVSQLGQLLIAQGSSIPGVREVRGAGLLIGIELLNADAKVVQKKLEERRILVNAANSQTIRVAPALVTNRDDVEGFLLTLRAVLEELS